jgi:hypothetical protein
MSGIVGDNQFRASGVVASSATDYDDDQIQSNIAMLGFYVAVNGSLVRYNLVDQSIDEYFDTSGVDAATSVNDRRVASGSNYYYDGTAASTPTVTEDADSSGVDGDYTWYKWTAAGSGSYNNDTTQETEYLIVAGGGAGGQDNGGAGGAGGYLAATGLSLTGGVTYTPSVGLGGAGSAGSQGASGGDSVLSGTGITTLTAVGGGGGGSGVGTDNGADGGSGGGNNYTNGGAAGAGTAGPPVQGYAGGAGSVSGSNRAGGGGGGGASAVGAAGTTSAGGDGGIGISNDITGSAVWYAGGGGGSVANLESAGGNQSDDPNGRTQGGGGKGCDTTADADATDNTGGGGGALDNGTGGDGGLGIVILRRPTSATASGGDLTLQSTDVSAVAEPDYGEFVTLIENAYGTATLNTDIKGYISRDSGTTFTQGTLANEGSWGTNKQITGFHDLDISAQPSGTSMCYKITTHNQSIGSKETRIYATSLGWK